MLWDEVGSDLQSEYPSLQSQSISFGQFRCRYYFLPSGFKDVGKSLLFGEVQWGSETDLALAMNHLESVARVSGCHKIVGPIDFSTYFNYRLKLNQFDQPHYFGEPANSPESVDQLLNLGFEFEKKYFSHEFKVKGNTLFLLKVILVGFWARFRTRRQIYLKSLNSINFQSYLKSMYELTDSVFSHNYLYQKIPYSSFQQFFNEKILPAIDSEASKIALDKNGELVGYSLCLKDVANNKRLLFKTIGVQKKGAHVKYVGRQLMFEVYRAARKKYQSCLACLMVEGNKPESMFRSCSFNTTSYALMSKKVF